jgi:hypothetical protein
MKNKRTMLHVIFKFMKNESRISNLVEEHEARTLSRGRNGWAHGLPPAPSASLHRTLAYGSLSSTG